MFLESDRPHNQEKTMISMTFLARIQMHSYNTQLAWKQVNQIAA